MRVAGHWLTAAGLAALLILVAIAALRVEGVFGFRALGIPHEVGWASPIFAPDGQSVYAVRRDVRAVVTGFGYASLTPPATVRVRRDRIDIVEIALSDGRVTVVDSFPSTPLEGTKMQTYHGAIFGEMRAHLRWSDATHLDYEIAVSRPATPGSRTYVTRKTWNPKTGTDAVTAPWTEASAGMGGDEPQQLAGDLEVVALPGSEGMACAIVLVRGQDSTIRALVDSRQCRATYASGYSAAVVAPFSRRPAIERAELIRRTYADLVERGRQSGLSEGQAMLDADDEMSRLGLYPKQTMLIARRTECGGTAETFEITDEQFKVGLFPDIERAIASPGRPVHKSMGDYITDRDYSTSQRLNAYLADGHTTFAVQARGGCWQLVIEK